jgi:hypothetical protein
MKAVFRSKIDRRLIWMPLAMPGVVLLALFTAPHGSRLTWIATAMLFCAAVIVCWIFAATYYELSADEIVAHCGPFSWHVPLADIAGIHESRTVRSGPALSMDRLEIVHGRGKVLVISPADKAGFVTAAERRVAALRSKAGPKPEK